MRKWESLARALLIEDIATISAVVFSVHEAKSGAASHADI
jgi:hypothetical protein